MANPLNPAGSPFQAMLDMAQRIEAIDDAATRGRAVIELSKAILSAQSQQVALVDEKRKLEEKVRKLEAWEADKERYQLKELPPGVFVFELMSGHAKPGEPIHQLCQNCLHKGEKRILSRDEEGNGVYNLRCDGCGNRWTIGYFRPSGSTFFRPGGGGGGPGDWMGN